MDIFQILANIGCYLFFCAGLIQLFNFICKKFDKRKENK